MSLMPQFKIVQGILIKVISSYSGPLEFWNPTATEITEAMDSGDDIIVRENHSGYPEGKSNLYKLDPNLKLLFAFELPSPKDFYVSIVALDEKLIRCTSRKGYFCALDVTSGKIVSKVFVQNNDNHLRSNYD